MIEKLDVPVIGSECKPGDKDRLLIALAQRVNALIDAENARAIKSPVDTNSKDH